MEEVLCRHPVIEEVGVMDLTDDLWIERVPTAVVLEGNQQVTEEAIIEFCKQPIVRFKAPKSVEFVESLPENPQGKILKRELRKK